MKFEDTIKRCCSWNAGGVQKSGNWRCPVCGREFDIEILEWNKDRKRFIIRPAILLVK